MHSHIELLCFYIEAVWTTFAVILLETGIIYPLNLSRQLEFSKKLLWIRFTFTSGKNMFVAVPP